MFLILHGEVLTTIDKEYKNISYSSYKTIQNLKMLYLESNNGNSFV